MPRNPNWGGARDNRSALARPTVKRIELDDDVAQMIRNGCIIRHGTATKADVTQYVNDLLRDALKAKE
jgi:hypothetical protein